MRVCKDFLEESEGSLMERTEKEILRRENLEKENEKEQGFKIIAEKKIT